MAKPAKARKTASLQHERHYFSLGCRLIVGIDEAGRGPLAGPVVAAAVALPLERQDLAKALRGVRDSKEMTAAQREERHDAIKLVASCWGIGQSSAEEIDQRGIVAAIKAAMQRALDNTLGGPNIMPDCLFLDAMLWPERRDIPQVSMVEADKHSLTVACASVLAKVWRDRYMIELDAKYGEYGFARHKGYGTAEHLRSLRRYGPCAAHRRSFKPVYELIGAQDNAASPWRESGGAPVLSPE
ncbi:MAG: ribonuclease HII [Chloroflexota bacterium]|nr:ribonuclease HII [Chloroflexota bacterium]MDE2947578.1 ribonuclease HII [Chloroflexota bacterium]